MIRASCDTLIIDVLGHLCVQLVRKHLLGNIGTVTRNAILLFNLAHRNFHQMRLGSEEGSPKKFAGNGPVHLRFALFEFYAVFCYDLSLIYDNKFARKHLD